MWNESLERLFLNVYSGIISCINASLRRNLRNRVPQLTQLQLTIAPQII
jgi:hypothetical protein